MCSGPQRGHPIGPKFFMVKFYMYVFNLWEFQSFACIGTRRKNSLLFCAFLGQKNEKSRFYRWKSSKIEKIKPKIENLGLLESKSRVSLSFKVFEIRIFENFLFDMPKKQLFLRKFLFLERPQTPKEYFNRLKILTQCGVSVIRKSQEIS